MNKRILVLSEDLNTDLAYTVRRILESLIVDTSPKELIDMGDVETYIEICQEEINEPYDDDDPFDVVDHETDENDLTEAKALKTFMIDNQIDYILDSKKD